MVLSGTTHQVQQRTSDKRGDQERGQQEPQHATAAQVASVDAHEEAQDDVENAEDEVKH